MEEYIEDNDNKLEQCVKNDTFNEYVLKIKTILNNNNIMEERMNKNNNELIMRINNQFKIHVEDNLKIFHNINSKFETHINEIDYKLNQNYNKLDNFQHNTFIGVYNELDKFQDTLQENQVNIDIKRQCFC